MTDWKQNSLLVFAFTLGNIISDVVVYLCTGTGVAPFRSIIQERASKDQRGIILHTQNGQFFCFFSRLSQPVCLSVTQVKLVTGRAALEGQNLTVPKLWESKALFDFQIPRSMILFGEGGKTIQKFHMGALSLVPLAITCL